MKGLQPFRIQADACLSSFTHEVSRISFLGVMPAPNLLGDLGVCCMRLLLVCKSAGWNV